MSETVTRRNVRARVTISTDVNDDTGRKRKRHADAQLAYSAGALHKLQIGRWVGCGIIHRSLLVTGELNGYCPGVAHKKYGLPITHREVTGR